MEITLLWLKNLWDALGRQFTAIGVAILAVVSLIMGHRYRVKQAGRTGRKEGETTERDRINAETNRVIEERREKVDEAEKDARTLDDDELTKRMLEQQTRRKRGR